MIRIPPIGNQQWHTVAEVVSNGVIAAVATPVAANGTLHVATFDRLIDFLIESGVDGLCLGGATSEYPYVDIADRKLAIGAAARRLPLDRALLVAIGASSFRQVLELGESAREARSRAVLLPMPMFFRYEQHDLEAFAIEVNRTLRMPLLLYDLPDFTNPLDPATVIRLLEHEELIVGIKDSSGIVGNLVQFAEARGSRPWTLIVGNDRLLFAGLKAGWNGTISGIACFCPSLVLAIHRSWIRGDATRAAHLQTLLNEAVLHLDTLPTPWGIRIALEAQGFSMGSHPLPLSPVRRQRVTTFREWVAGWMDRVRASVSG